MFWLGLVIGFWLGFILMAIMASGTIEKYREREKEMVHLCDNCGGYHAPGTTCPKYREGGTNGH